MDSQKYERILFPHLLMI